MESTTKYYICLCRGGHVGIHNYIPIKLAIIASSAKEASEKAKTKPRVKKNRKGSVIETKEVSYTEFINQYNSNNDNPYFKCHSTQDQRLFCNLDSELVHDEYYDEVDYNLNKDSRFDRIKRKKRLEELRFGNKTKKMSSKGNFYE